MGAGARLLASTLGLLLKGSIALSSRTAPRFFTSGPALSSQSGPAWIWRPSVTGKPDPQAARRFVWGWTQFLAGIAAAAGLAMLSPALPETLVTSIGMRGFAANHSFRHRQPYSLGYCSFPDGGSLALSSPRRAVRSGFLEPAMEPGFRGHGRAASSPPCAAC